VESHNDARDRVREMAEEEEAKRGGNFAQGVDQKPDPPEELLEPNFARGVSEEPPGGDRQGRFSTGEEEAPENPENNVERRFSEGIEQSPEST
jgi:hypothetical protein